MKSKQASHDLVPWKCMLTMNVAGRGSVNTMRCGPDASREHGGSRQCKQDDDRLESKENERGLCWQEREAERRRLNGGVCSCSGRQALDGYLECDASLLFVVRADDEPR